MIVRDTRESGPMLESALAAGIAAAGGDALLAGVLPTPAASVLVRRHGLDLAAVVSASHNPWADNGIKFFRADGRKLDDEAEEAIERRVSAAVEPDAEPGSPASEVATGRVREIEDALGDYVRELTSVLGVDLSGRAVVLDCANGATFRAAPLAFSRLGAEISSIGADPDGRNINEGCGSTHPEALAERVVADGAEIGFALDGDGDRLVAVDGSGTVRDGDELLALIARDQHERGALGGGVVATVMSNLGLHNALSEAGIELATTSVGDRHVGAALHERGWKLGGEQSGHVIWTDFAPTGDGIAAAILVMLALGSRPLAEAIPMRKLPQALRNVAVAQRDALEDSQAIREAVEGESTALEGRGRVLVRPSGTEPLVRIMVEAPEQSECDEVCARLAAVVERALG